MQKIHILAAGKLGEGWISEGCARYQKMISAFCNLSVTEIAEHRLSNDPSPAQIEKALEKEAEDFSKKLPTRHLSIALCVEGEPLSSSQLAGLLDSAAQRGLGAAFIIGSSHGLSQTLKSQADHRLTFSAMTFPHQLMRVMLLEQIYRCCHILNGGKYHK